ncbi:PilZ domain-containing protein [Asticcacaulis sp. 201]|uniref:PilZ domain-containing protein n=1 Tax=Asticcacaulis sp. 201 TaxID=3028787 RepID=UPI002916D546|nr:PilZ domain-containing protein [Asticcacaulis sp. 201]MDV6329871.1 PilZ domain-containing protein [Asticcacaulis sp. 201]
MEDRRSQMRQRTLKGARIVFNSGHSTISCLVRNLSATGALIKLSSPMGMPDDVELHFDDGQHYSCHIVRRAIDQIGVTFK